MPGHLGGSVGEAYDFCSGHDLAVHEFEHHILTTFTPDPLSPSLPAPPPLTLPNPSLKINLKKMKSDNANLGKDVEQWEPSYTVRSIKWIHKFGYN